MSITAMLAAAAQVPGTTGALLANPAKAGLDALAATRAGLSLINDAFQVPSIPGNPMSPSAFDGTTALATLDALSADISSAVVAKAGNIATELPMVNAAVNVTDNAAKVDAIASGNFSALPDPLAVAATHVNVCANPNFAKGFSIITDSNGMLTSTIGLIGTAFDPSIFSGLYSAVSSITGTAITSGTTFLTCLGTLTGANVTAVSAALNSLALASSDLVAAMQTAFGVVTGHLVDLSTSFTAKVAECASTVSAAFTTVKSNSLLSLISAPINSLIGSVLSACVNTSAVNLASFAISKALSTNQLKFPGDVSVQMSSNAATLNPNPETVAPSGSNTPVTSAALSSATMYSTSQMVAFSNAVDAAKNASIDTHAACAAWLKTNLEDWKLTVNFAAKKDAAGYTKASPDGTSTDPAAIAAWIDVRDVQRAIVAEYNHVIILPAKAAYATWEQIVNENYLRLTYGTHPYTTLAAMGQPVPDADQTTLLDSTK